MTDDPKDQLCRAPSGESAVLRHDRQRLRDVLDAAWLRWRACSFERMTVAHADRLRAIAKRMEMLASAPVGELGFETDQKIQHYEAAMRLGKERDEARARVAELEAQLASAVEAGARQAVAS